MFITAVPIIKLFAWEEGDSHARTPDNDAQGRHGTGVEGRRGPDEHDHAGVLGQRRGYGPGWASFASNRLGAQRTHTAAADLSEPREREIV